MPDYIVKSHIDTFLKTDTLSGARSALGVPGTSDFQTLCSTVNNISSKSNSTYTAVNANSAIWSSSNSSLHTLSGDIISIHQEPSILDDASLDEYIIVNYNGRMRTIPLANNLSTVYKLTAY